MMDRDYPMTSGQLRATAVGLLVAGIVGVALFGGYLPGLHPNYANLDVVTVDGTPYYWEAIVVPTPLPDGMNYTAPMAFPFHNVTFWLWVTDWDSAQGGLLHGNASVENGSQYAFELAGFGLSLRPASDYFSPDGEVGASWSGGPLADLYVRR
jgi:hypothetical protein